MTVILTLAAVLGTIAAMVPSIRRSIRENQEAERRHWAFMDAYWVQWNKECLEFRQSMREIAERNNAAKGE